jgi:hypothetical protein
VSLLIKKTKRRTARGKSINVAMFMTFAAPGIFDMPYESREHKRFVLSEVRYLVERKGRARQKAVGTSRDVNEARRWSEAVRRNAPLLDGFFAEEPEWREKVLAWCEKTTEPHKK